MDGGSPERTTNTGSMKRAAIVGKRSPGFSIPAIDGMGRNQFQASLNDFDDRWVILLFYPRDFSMI